MGRKGFPTIVCLCGSTRFFETFRWANLQETLDGKIVLSIGCDFKSDDALGLSLEEKKRLDVLHFRKIELADEVLILDEQKYIGASTAREEAYAHGLGKRVRYLSAEGQRCTYCPATDDLGMCCVCECYCCFGCLQVECLPNDGRVFVCGRCCTAVAADF